MDLQTPRVAVLIAAFNAEATIGRAIESLSVSGIPHVIYIVDDASRVPVASSIDTPQSKIKIIRLEKNLGVTKATNVGLDAILEEGFEFVAILDADDAALPGRLKKQVDFLDANQNVALVGTWVKVVHSTGHELLDWCPPTGSAELKRLLPIRNSVVHSSVMFRATALKEIGRYDETFDTSQDYELIFRVSRTFDIAVIPEFLTKYYISDTSISTVKRRRMAINSARVRLRNFQPARVASYLGILRVMPMLLIPRWAAIALRNARLFLAHLVAPNSANGPSSKGDG